MLWQNTRHKATQGTKGFLSFQFEGTVCYVEGGMVSGG